MLINAGGDPKGMITFFEMIKKEGMERPAALKYLSSHPLTEERIERLKRLVKEAQGPFVHLLREDQWEALLNICRSPAEELFIE